MAASKRRKGKYLEDREVRGSGGVNRRQKNERRMSWRGTREEALCQ